MASPPRHGRRRLRRILLWFAVSMWWTRADAQELEPRAYAASPVGVNFFVVSAARSSGGVLVDPSLPVEDVQATVRLYVTAVGRTVNMFGRTGLILAALPYAVADATGNVADETRRAARSGLADPRLKLSVNLVGGRALAAREFARAARRTILGVSFTVVPPLGQYQPTRLINLGANRWSFKPEAGLSHTIGRWTIEGYGGVWLFTTNGAFYTGESVRTQNPVIALQTHASYTLRPRLWWAVDGTWYSGGATSVNGVDKADLQRNSRLGATLSLPLVAQQSLKISVSSGATTRAGADFTTIAAAWQVTWMD